MHLQPATATVSPNTDMHAAADLAENGAAHSNPPIHQVPESRLARAARRLQPVMTTLLAAALILAIAAGLWRATGGVSPGFGDDSQPPTIPFDGAVTQEEGMDVDPDTLPVAEDCTVEPLTVDEVIAILKDEYPPFSTWQPGPGTRQSSSETDLSTSALSTPVGGSDIPGGFPNSEQMESVIAVQHMWLSCYLAESAFQVWALESPRLVQQQIFLHLPPLAGESEARAFLESVNLGESRKSIGTLVNMPMSPDHIPLVDPDPEQSWIFQGSYLIAGIQTRDSEGKSQGSTFPAQHTTAFAMWTNGPYGTACGTFAFGFDADRETWLVDSAGFGCG